MLFIQYAVEKARFEKLYGEAAEILRRLEAKGCIDKEALWIHESDEHV
jgi:hypothetical protein